MQCSQCDKEINCLKDIYVEFGQKLYHQECFECTSCNEKFNFVDKMPIIDKKGKLYCTNDFIKTLKCALCRKHLDLSSNVYSLKSIDQVSLLAHVECTQCTMCKEAIRADGEYVLDECKNELKCKKCFNSMSSARVKSVKSINHRLSSRQKEMLATKIISDNIDVEKEMICQEKFDLLLDTLSSFVKCSKKSLSNYILKHLNKSQNKKESSSKSIELMLNDLRSLDKIIAPPNQCPFPFKTTKIQIDLTNDSNQIKNKN